MNLSIGSLARAVFVAAFLTIPIHAQTARWGLPDDPTVKAMIAMEKMWLDQECGPQPGLKDVIADDFQAAIRWPSRTVRKHRPKGPGRQGSAAVPDVDWTWLKRAGKWQIVAAQDTSVACK